MTNSGSTFPDVNGLGQNLPETDPACYAIANYLMDGLNTALKEKYPKHIAVRDTVCYDAINPDLSRFPLLKVYRTTDTYSDFVNETSAVIAYCMSFPDIDKLPGIMRWVSKQINRLIRLWSLALHGCKPTIPIDQELKAEYRIMVNEVSQPVYAFLRISFVFKET